VIFDLSVVTDTLKRLVDTEWPNAPLWTPATPLFAVDVTGLSPDAVRQGQGAQLSLYLYHVEEDKATESLFWGAQAQSAGQQLHRPPLQYQPLALDLYYLLSAYAEGNYVQEQQAMSIAMRVFHENPVVSEVGPDGQPWQVTLTLERRSYDELSRLWQATTTALRLSAVYRASVVLLEPEKAPPPAPPVSVVNLNLAAKPDTTP
jgi:Pvc16 N-terminal domain